MPIQDPVAFQQLRQATSVRHNLPSWSISCNSTHPSSLIQVTNSISNYRKRSHFPKINHNLSTGSENSTPFNPTSEWYPLLRPASQQTNKMHERLSAATGHMSNISTDINKLPSAQPENQECLKLQQNNQLLACHSFDEKKIKSQTPFETSKSVDENLLRDIERQLTASSADADAVHSNFPKRFNADTFAGSESHFQVRLKENNQEHWNFTLPQDFSAIQEECPSCRSELSAKNLRLILNEVMDIQNPLFVVNIYSPILK